MKRQFIFIFALFCGTYFSYAQNNISSLHADTPTLEKTHTNVGKKWRLSQVHLSVVSNTGWYNDIDLDYMKTHATSNELFSLDFGRMKELLYQDVSSGGASLKLEFENTHSKIPQSFRLGVNYFGGKEAMITYTDRSYASNGDPLNYQYYTYCVIQDEIALSADYIWKLKPNTNWVNLYGGIGGTLSTSLNNELLLLMDSGDQLQEAKGSQFYRVQGLVGGELKLISRLKLNMEVTLGRGVETVGTKSYGFTNTGINFGLSFRL